MADRPQVALAFRIATQDDVAPLAKLYAIAVRTAGPAAYTPEQVDSWAASADDLDHFHDFILRPTTYVALVGDALIGFAGIEEDGHVASVYLHGDRQRQGVGTQLMHVLLEHARRENIERLYAEASEFSLPLFLKMGFAPIGTETVEHNGSTFVRHLVERRAVGK